MATITLHGNKINTLGQLPTNGQNAPDFELTAKDLSPKKLADYAGQNVILNIFPSIDTDVCAASVRKFNEEANALKNTKVLCISKDLPFAQNRFCGAEGLENVEMLSDFRGNFAQQYGVGMVDGPLAGLHSRAIVVLDGQGKVVHQEQVPEIVQEPNYASALQAIK